MKTFIKKPSKQNVFSIIEALIYIGIGLIFILDVADTKTTILYIFGIGTIIAGIIHLISFLTWRVLSFNLLRSAVELIAGTLIIILIPRLTEINFFGIIFGIYFLIIAVLLLEFSIDSKKIGSRLWWLVLVASFVIFTMGIILIFIKAAENVLTTVIGATLILDAVFTVIDTFTINRYQPEYDETLKDFFK